MYNSIPLPGTRYVFHTPYFVPITAIINSVFPGNSIPLTANAFLSLQHEIQLLLGGIVLQYIVVYPGIL